MHPLQSQVIDTTDPTKIDTALEHGLITEEEAQTARKLLTQHSTRFFLVRYLNDENGEKSKLGKAFLSIADIAEQILGASVEKQIAA